MQIGKLWTTAVAILFGLVLSACYDDNGNNTTSGSGTPSTNNLAPATLANRTFNLQYNSGPLVGVLETLQISADTTTFIRTPQVATATQSKGNFLTPVLSQGGNVWTAVLNTTFTNSVPTTNTVTQTLKLTFTTAQSGTFTIVSNDNGTSSGGAFNLLAAAELNDRKRFLRTLAFISTPLRIGVRSDFSISSENYFGFATIRAKPVLLLPVKQSA